MRFTFKFQIDNQSKPDQIVMESKFRLHYRLTYHITGPQAVAVSLIYRGTPIYDTVVEFAADSTFEDINLLVTGTILEYLSQNKDLTDDYLYGILPHIMDLDNPQPQLRELPYQNIYVETNSTRLLCVGRYTKSYDVGDNIHFGWDRSGVYNIVHVKNLYAGYDQPISRICKLIRWEQS